MRILEDYENKKHHEALVNSSYGNDVRYIKSPLLRASVLYWAIYYQLDIKDYVIKLLNMESVYPDLPLQSIFGRNCFHACCAGGNKQALLVLIDTDERYNKLYQKHIQEKNNSRYSDNKSYVEREEAEKMFSIMVEESKGKIYTKEFLKYIKEATQWVIRFEQELEKFSTEKKEMPRYFEVQDIFGNTPLHIASFLGKAEIVEALLSHGKYFSVLFFSY